MPSNEWRSNQQQQLSVSKKCNSIIHQNGGGSGSPSPLLKYEGSDDNESIKVMMDYQSLKKMANDREKIRSGASTRQLDRTVTSHSAYSKNKSISENNMSANVSNFSATSSQK